MAAKSKRLAITISGAVSLGSYEAGVLYEVLRALGEHNEDPATTEAERIEVDVLTGASAGGMTATIAAQVLLGGNERLASASDNAFFKPWVEEVDLAGLLTCDPKDDPATHSILASSLVEKLGAKHIVDRPDGAPHPAAPKSGVVRLGLAMSQLNGVDYTKKAEDAAGPSEFTYTRFQDEFTCRIPGPLPATDWPKARAAALACGAFPFAFRCRGLVRRQADYPSAAAPFTSDPREMAFLDGGIFHNEPLGLAKNLVEEIDEHRDNDSRFYLFVSPGRKTGVSDGAAPLRAADLTLLRTAKSLMKSVFWQARFQDWINAEKMNQRIASLDVTARNLAEQMLRDPALAQAIEPGVAALLPLYFAGRAGELDTAVARLRIEYEQLKTPAGPRNFAAELGEPAATIWLKAVLLLEHAAGLAEKETMAIYTITADDQSLAGEKFFAFAGFMDERARRHDYNVGRENARRWLRAGADGLFPIRASFAEPIPPIDPRLGEWELKAFDREKRQALVEQVRDRAGLMMKELGVGGFLRGVIDTFVLRPKLRKAMGL